MKFIRLTPLPLDDSGKLDWSVCVKEREIDENEFLALNDPNVIPFYEIWEQEETTLSKLAGCEVCRNTPTVDHDTFAINDSEHKFILIRATRYHVLIRIENINKKVNDHDFCSTVLLDSRYSIPEDWNIKN